MLNRLEIEINCREHFTVFGYRQIPYQINSRWFSGGGNIVTYSLEELLGSKLRALFQRKKGRDLFDIWYCLKYQKVNVHNLISAFDGFLQHDKRTILKDEFLDNIADKISDPDFRNDTTGLIRPEIDYDLEKCWNLVRSILLPVMKPELGLHSK